MTTKDYEQLLNSLNVEDETKEKAIASFVQGEKEMFAKISHFLATRNIGICNDKPTFSFTQEEWDALADEP